MTTYAWIACDTGAKRMAVVRTEGKFVYGRVWSPRRNEWSKTKRWRQSLDGLLHATAEQAREVYRTYHRKHAEEHRALLAKLKGDA